MLMPPNTAFRVVVLSLFLEVLRPARTEALDRP